MKKIVLLFTLLINVPLYAQHDLNWHVGACTRIDFRSGSMILSQDIDSVLNVCNNTSYSKNDSTFSFFTNGTIVYRANGTIMPNGDTLAPTHYTIAGYPNGAPFSQGCIILNEPNSDSILYLFYQAIDNDMLLPISKKIYLAKIDINADSGNGVVLSKNIVIYNSSDTLMWGKLQAVKHANGRDWWLVSKKHNQNVFLEWLILPDTIIGPFRKYYNGPKGIDSYFVQSAFSLDGSKYAIIFQDMCLQVFDFDRCTGEFNLIFNNIINDPGNSGGGVAFSTGGQYLYAVTSMHCWQFDMNAAAVFASGVSIATYDGFVDSWGICDFAFCRLAPDGKIYIAPGSTNAHWSRINNPNLPDTQADLEQHIINLYCYNNVNFPNVPNFNLGPLFMSSCDTITEIQETSTNKISIFPNPTNSSINLSGQLTVPLEYSIYDIAGRKIIYRTNYFSGQINVEALHTGLYILTLKDKLNNVFNLKFVRE